MNPLHHLAVDLSRLMTIAIDFGTSNTVVTRWNAATGTAETVRLPLSSPLGDVPVVPSLVYVEDAASDRVIVGQAVRDRGLDVVSDRRFFRSFKRGIGADIQGFLPELDGKLMRFERVGELFLRQVIEAVRAVPLPTESLILTVPVESFEVYRQWLGQVCAVTGIDRVRLIDEPTAAALGYGATAAKNLLVVDFGGGTLDLSLVQLDRGTQNQRNPLGFILKWGEKSFVEESGQKVETARVLAKSGQDLGGTDIDNWLVDYFATTQGLAKNALTTRLAERLKIQLSQRSEATEVYFDEANFESYELKLDRATFEQILREHDFFERLDRCLNQVVQQAQRQDVTLREIDTVLLVGGSVQIPAVQRWIEGYFPAEKIRQDRPLEAIAIGALQLEDGIEVRDFLQHSYGIRFWDRRKQAHSWHPIIQAGQPYPTQNPIEITLGASLDQQPKIELILGELGDRTTSTEIFFDGDRLITRVSEADDAVVKPLNDTDAGRVLAELDPPGVPGSDRIKVQFRIDDQRFLRVTVEDLLRLRVLIDDRPAIELG
jgi:molecular chaperone DnaK (HSP70)